MVTTEDAGGNVPALTAETEIERTALLKLRQEGLKAATMYLFDFLVNVDETEEQRRERDERIALEQEVLQAYRKDGPPGAIHAAAEQLRREMLAPRAAQPTNVIQFPKRPRSGKPAGRRGRVLKFKKPRSAVRAPRLPSHEPPRAA